MTFNTCDLLDDNETKSIQVLHPNLNGAFFRQFGGKTAFYGQIATVKCFEDNSRVKELLATDGTGKVLVVDGGASFSCALMGDMIGQSAVNNNWQGVIIYGCVRDVDVLATLDLGIYALASIPQKSTRKGIGDVGVDLTIGNVKFCQDDYVYADNNGIIVCDKPLI